MASILKSFLGYGNQTPPNLSTQRGLPTSWYTSKHMYELERRAIFSQRWLMITHRNRFVNAGDYASFTEAGFPFFLCLDREGKLRGFHNICRHRAFPVLHHDSGNAKILACKYHGWSYGINGKLAKAPHFEGLADFEKGNNDLFPIHVHIDQLGFVWVNLDAAKEPKIAWDDEFLGVDTQTRFAGFDFARYKFDHTWRADGDYNWKTLADNYNECLHCKVAHPDVAGIADVKVYKVEGQKSHLQHFANIEGTSAGKEVKIASTYYFPNNCMTVSPHFFYMMRCVPTSERSCSMEYEVYRHEDASDEDFEHIDALFKRILQEDKYLCNNTQKNLNVGVYVNGQLHPSYEQGPLYFQTLVKDFVMKHRTEEEKAKKEIWPASQNVLGSDKTDAEIAFCAALDPERNKALAW